MPNVSHVPAPLIRKLCDVQLQTFEGLTGDKIAALEMLAEKLCNHLYWLSHILKETIWLNLAHAISRLNVPLCKSNPMVSMDRLDFGHPHLTMQTQK